MGNQGLEPIAPPFICLYMIEGPRIETLVYGNVHSQMFIWEMALEQLYKLYTCRLVLVPRTSNSRTNCTPVHVQACRLNAEGYTVVASQSCSCSRSYFVAGWGGGEELYT